MKIPAFRFAILLFLLFIVAAYLYAPLRYLKYTLPCFALILVSLARPSTSIEPKHCRNYIWHYFKLYSVLLLISGITVLVRSDAHLRFLSEAYFILSPLVFLVLLSQFYDHKDSQIYVNLLLYGATVAFLLDVWSAISGIGPNLYELMTTSVESSTESNVAFSFGLFAVYFLVTGRYRFFVLASILTLFSLKKIALLALALIILIYLIAKSFRCFNILSSKYVPITIVFFNILYIVFIVSFAQGEFDEIFLQSTGLSADAFTMGRQTLYNDIISAMLPSVLWGNGLGKATHLLMSDRYILLNLHSDVLKYFLEFGIPLFIAWIYFLYRITIGNPTLLLITLYFNILMLTDNVSIYTDFMTIFYILGTIAYVTSQRTFSEVTPSITINPTISSIEDP